MKNNAYVYEHQINDDLVLTFITDRKQTVCKCDELDYFKLVARHKNSKASFKNLHDSVKKYFPIYIEDVKRYLSQ